MRIAQVAPLAERVPPRYYGGTERVVSYLTEELVHQGHEVTLFATGDSVTTARLHPICEEALRLSPKYSDPLPYHVLQLEKVLKEADAFDVIHFHNDHLHFPAFRRQPTASITTMHGRLDLPDLMPLFQEFSDAPVVSISDYQRVPLPWQNWVRTVYHGVPEDLLEFHRRPGSYLAFLGRICPEKRPDRAIRIACEAGMELKIAAKVDVVDQRYFERVIKPMLSAPNVEFLGEITESEKNDFLGHACALLFPIDWPEPFGLAMIEAMACGTPVIAFRNGSVPEVIENGITGFIVDDEGQAAAAVRQVHLLDRDVIRRRFEQRFSARRMANDYLSIYKALVEASFRKRMDVRFDAPAKRQLSRLYPIAEPNVSVPGAISTNG